VLEAGEGEDLDARGRRALDAYSNALEAVSSEADEDLARLDTMLGERRES
jgi:hypothetical protein